MGLSDPIAQSETLARGFYRQVALHLADLGIRVESRPDAKSRRIVFLWRHRDINALAHRNSYKNHLHGLVTATVHVVHRPFSRGETRIKSKCDRSADYRKCYTRTCSDLSAQIFNIARLRGWAFMAERKRQGFCSNHTEVAIAGGMWQKLWQISGMVLCIFPCFPAAFLRDITRSYRSRPRWNDGKGVSQGLRSSSVQIVQVCIIKVNPSAERGRQLEGVRSRNGTQFCTRRLRRF